MIYLDHAATPLFTKEQEEPVLTVLPQRSANPSVM